MEIQVGNEKQYWRYSIFATVGVALCLFIWSAYRHYAFRSEAFDLAIFDQALWLISNNQYPESSLIGRHILGDHFSLILYPLSLVYRIYPSVYWLFLIQSAALAGGAPILFAISKKLGATARNAWLVSIAYLCHPIVTNVSLFDFHPECIAVVCILAAVLAALNKHTVTFIFFILLAISCKEILTLTVLALGVLLVTPIFGNTKKFGLIAMAVGLITFPVIFFYILPGINGGNAGSAGLERYGVSSGKPGDIVWLYLSQPSLLISRLHLLQSIKYVFKLLIPYFFVLQPENLLPLIGAIPVFGLNVLSDLDLQRTIRFQYALPILPFLGLMVSYAISTGRLLIRREKIYIGFMLLWLLIPIARSLIRHSSEYPHAWRQFDGQQKSLMAATRLIPANGVVLAPSYVIPHFSHRKDVHLLQDPQPNWSLRGNDFIFINTRHPGWMLHADKAKELVQLLDESVNRKRAERLYAADDIFVYKLLVKS